VEISDNVAMCNNAVEFYKNLFGEEPKENIRLNGDFWQEGENILPEENDSLESEITEEEVSQAIQGSYAEGWPWASWLLLLVLP
jgi:hypothetical protein